MEIEKLRCEICGRQFVDEEALASHNSVKHNGEKSRKEESGKGFSPKVMIISGIVFLAIVGIIAFSILGHATTAPINSNAVNSNVVNTDIQTATLKVQGASYILEPSTFKKGVPVRILADIPNMPGCSKTVTIPAFNILKFVTSSDNVISFTPDKTGTFKIACSMSMYTGTFTVE